MLPTRDRSQNKRPIHTDNEGLENNTPSKWIGKKAGVAILMSDKIDFKTKAIKRDPEGHFIILTGRIHQADKIYKQTCTQHNLIIHIYYTYIYITFHSKEAKYTFLSNVHETFSKIDHMIGHETSINKL